MRCFLHSRLAIAIAASVLTITAIGGVTYATSSSSGDTYYACAAVNGMIRASWIRLNTAPEKCPISTDHIVQWAAGGQPITPKTGTLIPLDGPITLARPLGSAESPKVAWPAVDTSMCRNIAAYVKYSGVTDQQASTWIRLTAVQRIPGDNTDFGELRADVSGDYGIGTGGGLGPGVFTGAGSLTWGAEKTGAIVGPSTVIAAQLYLYYPPSPAQALTVTIDDAWLYCTPY